MESLFEPSYTRLLVSFTNLLWLINSGKSKIKRMNKVKTCRSVKKTSDSEKQMVIAI